MCQPPNQLITDYRLHLVKNNIDILIDYYLKPLRFFFISVLNIRLQVWILIALV